MPRPRRLLASLSAPVNAAALARASPIWIGEAGRVDRAADPRSSALLLTAPDGARARLLRGYGGSDIADLAARFYGARTALGARPSGG